MDQDNQCLRANKNPPNQLRSEQIENGHRFPMDKVDSININDSAENTRIEIDKQKMTKSGCLYTFTMLVIGLTMLGYCIDYVWNKQMIHVCLVKEGLDTQLQCLPSQKYIPNIQRQPHTPTQTIKQMQVRIKNSVELSQKKPSKKHKPSPQALFAFNLHENPTNTDYLAAEMYYYNEKYNISKYVGKQLPLCVVCSGRNLEFQHRFSGFLASLNRQLYGNFKVVVVDDASTDNTINLIKKKLEQPQFAKLKSKLTIIQNTQRRYALYSRNLAIRNHCKQGDIIIELDSDDQLIGSQVFSTINAIYSANPQVWVMYSSYIYWSPVYGQPSQGISGAIPARILQLGTYRESTQWFTSATRTFRRQLYMKIDEKDFLDQYGRYHQWTSDLFVHYSLVQMAGIEHYKYVHEIFYFYYKDHNVYDWIDKALNRLTALSVKPYIKLNSLESVAERKQQERDLSWIQKQKQRLQRCRYERNSENCKIVE